MNRFPLCRIVFIATGALFLAGCEGPKPPGPDTLRKIAARTATGTVTTKLEARVDPPTPKAGEWSFWDLKVFDFKDAADGTRTEWKFFNPLPQTSDNLTISTVQMNAWVISRDGRVFLPKRPKYQAYGSFNTDWTIPRAGKYLFFAEYQPAKSGKVLFPIEMARWEFTVAPGKSGEKPVSDAPHWSPTRNPLPITVGGAPDGEPAGTLNLENMPTQARETKAVAVRSLPDGAQGLELVALTADGQFFHFQRDANGTFPVVFPQTGMVRIWAYFTLNDVPYAAPMNQLIS